MYVAYFKLSTLRLGVNMCGYSLLLGVACTGIHHFWELCGTNSASNLGGRWDQCYVV